jgi:hypothetical protein
MGDVDGDGCPDLGILAPGPFGAKGRLKIVSAQKGGVIAQVPLDGIGGGPRVLAEDCRDLNGDGVYDVVVADRRARVGSHERAGVVSVLLGTRGTKPWQVSWSDSGKREGQESGMGLATLPHLVDGKPRSDVIVLDRGPEANGREGIRRLDGRTGKVVWEWSAAEPGESLSPAITCAGDMNGDGVRDLVVGSWSTRESAEYGVAVSGADGSAIVRMKLQQGRRSKQETK